MGTMMQTPLFWARVIAVVLVGMAFIQAGPESLGVPMRVVAWLGLVTAVLGLIGQWLPRPDGK